MKWMQAGFSHGDGACAFPFDPRLPAVRSPALWHPELLPDSVTLVVALAASSSARPIDPGDFPSVLADRQGDDGRYVILADPDGYHRLWLTDADPNGVRAVLIPLDDHFRQRLTGALRFHRHLLGERSGPVPPRVDLTPMQRNRLMLMLRAFDGHEADASYRQIAAVLFDSDIT